MSANNNISNEKDMETWAIVSKSQKISLFVTHPVNSALLKLSRMPIPTFGPKFQNNSNLQILEQNYF